MSIRYFRHAGPPTVKEVAKEKVEDPFNTTKVNTASEEADNESESEEEEGSSEGSENSENSESDSSSEEEEITYHKPVFLKRKPLNSSQQEQQKPVLIEQDDKKRSEQRIQHSLNVSRNIDINKINIDENYTSTDKDLLKRTIELNDDDTIDPELERSEWEARQQARLKRERQLLVDKQLDAEERQERHLKRSVPLKEPQDSSNHANPTTQDHKKFKPTVNYKPQRVTSSNFNAQLPSSNVNGSIDDDSKNNEYSML
ncbi:pre-mRNA-splicing factor Spp381p [Monosporozyma unispora]